MDGDLERQGSGTKDMVPQARASLVAQMVKNPPAMWETGLDPWVGKIPWRREWLPTAVFLPRESPWTEDPGGLQSMGVAKSGTNTHLVSLLQCPRHLRPQVRSTERWILHLPCVAHHREQHHHPGQAEPRSLSWLLTLPHPLCPTCEQGLLALPPSLSAHLLPISIQPVFLLLLGGTSALVPQSLPSCSYCLFSMQQPEGSL